LIYISLQIVLSYPPTAHQNQWAFTRVDGGPPLVSLQQRRQAEVEAKRREEEAKQKALEETETKGRGRGKKEISKPRGSLNQGICPPDDIEAEENGNGWIRQTYLIY
jgi:hypothetical protein